MKPITTTVALFFILRSVAIAQSVIDPSLTVQPLVAGLSSPTSMAFVGPDDILVLQKNDGRVRRVVSGVLQAGEVLDVAVDSASERGLLGIALHPNFPGTPFVYLYFTESSTGADTPGSPTPLGNRVYRYTWNGSKLTSPNLILALPVTPGANHNGGIIAFGPDDKLYVVIGDLNRNGQLQNFSSGPPPDDTGVIFRLNDNGSTPTDNPFQGEKVNRYYAYGIRNSFGMTFDPVTGKLWMTENGPNVYDEINLVEEGFNSGWEQLMGPDARDPQGIGNLFPIPGAQYRDPSFSWLDPVGPTGLVFLNSTALGSQYLNNLFVGDINGGVLYRFRPNSSRDGFVFQNSALSDRVADNSSELSELIFGTGFGGITDIKVGPDGFLYVVSFSGQIFVISPAKPVVAITAPDATATEAGATTGFFTVSRSGSRASSLTVTYTIGGSAGNGVDFQTLTGSVTIPAGSSSANIIVRPIDDSNVESNETVILTIRPNAAYTIGSPASATVTLLDNDGADTTPPNTSVTSGPTGTITVTGATFAWSGTDNVTSTPNLVYAYRLAPLEPNFSAFGSATTKSYTNLASGNYTFFAKAKDKAGNEDPTPASRVFTVNAPVVTLIATAATAVEGGASGAFRVTRTGSTGSPLTVFYTLGGTAASGTDYTLMPAPSSVTIPAGASSATITVIPINDAVMEGNETVIATLTPRSNYTVGSPSSATVTLVSNQRVAISTADSIATEAGLTTGIFTVTRTGSTGSPLTVFYTLGGTAASGTDYTLTPAPSSVTIQAGTSSATITVTPINDAVMEGNETVIVTLSPRSNYTVGFPGSAAVTLVSDERVTISATDSTATETGPTTGIFTVTRTGSTGSPLTVFYTLGGTAATGTDYTLKPAPSSVTIQAGASSATITVTPINDAVMEGNETVIATLSPRSNYTVGSPSSAAVTLVSNE